MLVLSRDCDTVIRIGPDIKVKVLSIRKQRVKLGVDAPNSIRVWRDEIAPEASRTEPPDLIGDEAPSSEGNPFSILVVEDDPEHAELISRVLTDCHFQDITLASSGRSAIDALGERSDAGAHGLQPNLVLLDLHLPDISGIEVLRRIRADNRRQTMPIVVLSSEREDSIVADCLEAGANAFVNKSLKFKEFRDSVSRIANFWRSDCRTPRRVAQTPA